MSDETAGKGIAACGTSATARKLADALNNAGLPGKAYPLVRLEKRAGWDEGLDFSNFDWIVFTSPSAARFTVESLESGFSGRTACVGRGTAKVVREAGLNVDLVPMDQSRDGLREEFAKLNDRNARVFIPVSSAAPMDLMDGLAELGFQVTAPVVYDNLPDDPVMRAFANDIEKGELAAAAFTSPSAVDYGNFALGLPDIRIYCIGRSTADQAERKGLKVFGIAYESSVEGLVDIIKANENPDA